MSQYESMLKKKSISRFCWYIVVLFEKLCGKLLLIIGSCDSSQSFPTPTICFNCPKFQKKKRDFMTCSFQESLVKIRTSACTKSWGRAAVRNDTHGPICLKVSKGLKVMSWHHLLIHNMVPFQNMFLYISLHYTYIFKRQRCERWACYRSLLSQGGGHDLGKHSFFFLPTLDWLVEFRFTFLWCHRMNPQNLFHYPKCFFISWIIKNSFPNLLLDEQKFENPTSSTTENFPKVGVEIPW